MRKHLKANAYGCAGLLLITATAKLYSHLAGTLAAFGTVDPVIGLPVSMIVPTVSVLEIIFAICLLKWPLSYACHVSQVSLFAAFGWYRFLLSGVLRVNFGCYCAGAIFHTNPVFDIVAHISMTVFVWVLLVYSVILLILRTIRGEIENDVNAGPLSNARHSQTGSARSILCVSSLVFLILAPHCTLEASGIQAQKVSGVLYETDYKLGTRPQVTNAYLISGVVSGSNFLVTCKNFELTELGGGIRPRQGSVLEYVCVGSEGGVLRTVREELFEKDGQLRTNTWLQVEPYLVPRVFNKPVKVAVLCLTKDLASKINSTRYPIFMSALPRYPIFDLDITAEENAGVLRVIAQLKKNRKRKLVIWELFVSQASADHNTNLGVSFRQTAHDISYVTEVTGTLRLEETTLHSNFLFRPYINPPARVVDYSLIDQLEILKRTDLSAGIHGGVSYTVTNVLWEYDASAAQQAAPVVKRAVLAQASADRIRSVRWAFGLGIVVLLLLPLLLVRWGRKPKPSDRKNNSTY